MFTRCDLGWIVYKSAIPLSKLKHIQTCTAVIGKSVTPQHLVIRYSWHCAFLAVLAVEKKCFSIEFRKEAYWGCYYFVCCVGGHKAIYLLYMKLDSVQTANSTCNLILMAQLHEKMHATVVIGSILQMFSFALVLCLHILLDWLWPFSCLQVILAR